MTSTPNTFRDETPEQGPNRDRIELGGLPSFPEIIQVMGDLEQALLSESALSTTTLSSLVSRLGEMTAIISKNLNYWRAFEHGYWGRIHVQEMTHLSTRVAKIISDAEAQKSDGWLDFQNLEILDTAAAEILAHWRGKVMTFDGLSHIDVATAHALTAWQGEDLQLGGLQALDAPVAEALMAWQGVRIEFNSVTLVDRETAQVLADWNGTEIILEQVHSLPPDIMEILVQAKAKIILHPDLQETYDIAQDKHIQQS